jgi:hypothetical protein
MSERDTARKKFPQELIMWTVCACFFLVGQAGADWQDQEAAHLKNIRQVTRDYVRAGEGYFSPDGSKIIFQAEEKGDNPFYQMFVMDLKTGSARRVSPGVGKTTCGYFHPDGTKIIFASSHLDPDARKYQESGETPSLRLGLRSPHGYLRVGS